MTETVEMPDLSGKVLGIVTEANVTPDVLRELLEPFLSDLGGMGLTVQVLQLSPGNPAGNGPPSTARPARIPPDTVVVVLLPPPLNLDLALQATVDLVFHASLCLHQHVPDSEGFHA